MSVRFKADPVTGAMAAIARSAAGSFSAAGTSPAPHFSPQRGDFSFTVRGTFTGSLRLERSTDGGATWVAISASPGGGPATWTAEGLVVLSEPESRALYCVRATALSAGAAFWRLGQ